MKRKYYKLAIVIAAVALIGFYAIKIAGKASAESEAVNVSTDAAVAVEVQNTVKTDISITVNLNGKLKPVQEINIIPKASGKVNNIYFDFGQRVKAGDILFTLEDKDFRSQQKQAQAALDIANSSLSKATGGAVELQDLQLKTALDSAEISYNDAKKAYERTKQLFESGAVSMTAMEQVESQLKLAEHQYNSSKANYEITTTKTNPENIAAAKAQVSQASAALELAKSQLDNTVVRSPINGIIASSNIEEGELVGVSGVAMSVIDLSSVILDVNATEDMINKVKQGDKVDVIIKAAGDIPVLGEITNISPAMNPSTQSYPVRIKIGNESGILKGGMFAETSLILDEASNVIAVPISAVINENGKKYLYIFKDNTAVKREVETGLSDDSLIVITKGLSENEAVIVKGQEYVADGSKVTTTSK